MIDTFHVGDIAIRRIIEIEAEFPDARAFIAGTETEHWTELRNVLAPDHWDPELGAARFRVQSWVVSVGGRTVVVDTGVGNERDRPHMPAFDGLRGSFLSDLADAGVEPESVDTVVTTHLHSDHVGWNTRRDGDDFVPTFPNATYHVPEADLVYFDPANESARRPPATEADRLRMQGSRLVWADSVAPVLDAGLVSPWSDELRLDTAMTIRPAAGHTPGSSVLEVSGADTTVWFVGDLLHSPLQLHHPHHNSCFCDDPEAARATRTRILAEAADRDIVLVPAHFAGTGVCRVDRSGSAFRVAEWMSPARPDAP